MCRFLGLGSGVQGVEFSVYRLCLGLSGSTLHGFEVFRVLKSSGPWEEEYAEVYGDPYGEL